MSKLELDTVLNANSLATINSNFQKIEQELQEKVLYRNNPVGEPNSVETDIDLNGKQLLNPGGLILDGEIFAPVEVVEGYKDDAEAAAVAAQTAADLAEVFGSKYLGAAVTNPSTTPTGAVLEVGMLYYNSALSRFKVFDGASWVLVFDDIASLQTASGSNSIGYNPSQVYDPNTVGSALKTLDYREGSFVPDLYFGNATTGVSYQYRNGSYSRIGNMCFVRIRIKLTSKGTATGTANIRGIPFSYLSSTYPPGLVFGEFSSMAGLPSGYMYAASAIGHGSGRIDIVQHDLSGSSTNPLVATNGAFTNASIVDLSFMFWAQN